MNSKGNNNIRNTEEAVLRPHYSPIGYYTDQGPYGRGQYDGQGVYFGLSTTSEVFLIFTTQQYSCQCSYDATF